MKHMYSWAVRFKRRETREKSTGWEDGIALGPAPDDCQVIIDSNFQVVPEIYDFSSRYFNGAFSIEVKPKT